MIKRLHCTYTNKDGETIILAHHAFSQKRLASTDNPVDFKGIFERELAKKGFSDKSYNSNLFKDQLFKHVQGLIELHEKKYYLRGEGDRMGRLNNEVPGLPKFRKY